MGDSVVVRIDGREGAAQIDDHKQYITTRHATQLHVSPQHGVPYLRPSWLLAGPVVAEAG